MPPTEGFDITAHVRRVARDMVERVPDLRHIRLDLVGFSVAQTRKRSTYGVHASLTPLRFEGGRRVGPRHGRPHKVQRVLNRDGQEILYILTLYLPRFMDVPLAEKLNTILHELWHIGPKFDGDIRRHAGRCYAHSASQAQYDRHVERLVQRYLASSPPENVYDFLRLNFVQLSRRYGPIFGTRYRRPKLLPVAEDKLASG